MTTTQITTARALDAVAWGRAPRVRPNHWVNRRIVCADGYKVSVQASSHHYAHDSRPAENESPYWQLETDPEIIYPWTSFELGNPSSSFSDEACISEDDDGSGVCAWMPRDRVQTLLDAHGGAVSWEDPVEVAGSPRRGATLIATTTPDPGPWLVTEMVDIPVCGSGGAILRWEKRPTGRMFKEQSDGSRVLVDPDEL